MRIVLMGEKGVGKTHLCSEVVARVKKHNHICCGVITWNIKGKLVIEDIFSGKKETLAFEKDSLRKGETGIPFCSYLFKTNAIEFAHRALSRTGDLLVIDEVGPLELEGNGFRNVLPIFCSNRNSNSIMVIRSSLKERVIALLKCDFTLFEVNKTNRDDMRDIVFRKLLLNTNGTNHV